VVNHFTNANGLSQSQELINAFCDNLRAGLETAKVAQQILGEGAAVADADAADSLVIEGRFTDFDKGSKWKISKLNMDIGIYRINDHALVKTISAKTVYSLWEPGGNIKDSEIGEVTARQASKAVKQALKDVNLSSIPAGPPVPRPVPSAPVTAAAPAAVLVFASVQLSSTPAGAEITIDGNDAGNTPSLIKLRPGTHSIRITKDGYAPWQRSIDTSAGESRTVAATLEKASQ